MKRESNYNNFGYEDFVEDEKFRNWIFSPDEESQFFWETFIKNNPNKKGTVQIAREIVESIHLEEKPISREEYIPSLTILKHKIIKQNKPEKNIYLFPNWWNKIAVILLIPFITISIYFYFSRQNPVQEGQKTQYIVPPGQKSNVILADGTSVWLNSGSTLTYFIGNKLDRKVHLEGEAFFDVTKDKKRPFLVETDKYTVKVYGTSFNVRAFKEQVTSEIILEEGAVSVITGKNEEIKLKPNQRFYINEENKYQVSHIDPEYYTCWKDNILRVNNEELQHLIVRLERWYGVSISIPNFEKVKNLRYTLTIKTESCREMLELMRLVTPFTYTIKGENITINYDI
ncbi:FecR family protein [Maribellus maritimus]|uniref:FecR family protein n=1 Tax=Maribellus maritimus TaxID=2870838 RepID=UPI001EEA416E|nr:FecR family protein [Maribellus maritimus]MCG6190113.1 FecR family protein [Maribellus maritimus]